MTTALHRPPARAVLERLLDEPAVAAQIAALEPAALGALIRAIGLEDAGELVALATTEQLLEVFDEDLWRRDRPGDADGFDAARFAIWLEVLMEAGDAVVARQLAALPEELVTLALHAHLLVLDVDALAEDQLGCDDRDELARTDKALASSLGEELDGYHLIARRHDGWDTVLAAVVALDRDHRALLVRILDRLVALDRADLDARGGLHAVLTDDEMLVNDAAAERDDRRAAIGHVAPRDAASFLALARDEAADATVHDPITRAYFRQLVRTPQPPPRPDSALRAWLATADLDDDDPIDRRRALPSTSGEPTVLAALRALADDDAAPLGERRAELAYLANVLVAGATIGVGRARRPVRPVEAARAAVAIVDRGIAIVAAPHGATPPAIVAGHGLDALFRIGWARLHRDATQRGLTFATNDLEILNAVPPTPQPTP